MQDIQSHIRICDNYAIRIDRNGQWWHQGAPITRHNLVTLFARQLTRDADGSYWLQTPAERGIIVVDDLPFVATQAEWSGDVLRITTNCGDVVDVGGAHPLRLDDIDGDLRPAVHVRGDLWARITRAIYYDLATHVVPAPDGSGLRGITSAGVFFALERVQDSGVAA